MGREINLYVASGTFRADRSSAMQEVVSASNRPPAGVSEHAPLLDFRGESLDCSSSLVAACLPCRQDRVRPDLLYYPGHRTKLLGWDYECLGCIADSYFEFQGLTNLCTVVLRNFSDNEDGSMPHTIAEIWVGNMALEAYAGQTGWVLPPIGDDDPNCSVQHTTPVEDDFGFHCDGSPLGTLYYDRLKLAAGTPVVAAPNINIHGFNNLQPYLYWGCTLADDSLNLCQDAPPAEGFAWSFSFGNGFQGTDVVGNNLYVMVYYPETPAQVLAEGISEYLGTGPQANAFQAQATGLGSAPTLEAKAAKLQAFLNHVSAQRGKALTSAQADYLIALAQAI